jgi:hypothetical protein
MKQEGMKFKDKFAIIEDAGNEIIALSFFVQYGIEEVKKVIAENGLRTIEEYTGRETKELNAIKPRICEDYNKLISDLKSPDLTIERVKEILDELSILIKR